MGLFLLDACVEIMVWHGNNSNKKKFSTIIVIVLIDELDVRKWKMSNFSSEFALPLAIYGHFGDGYNIANF